MKTYELPEDYLEEDGDTGDMQRHEPGIRVGALLGVEDKVVEWLGYGEYLGDEVPDEDARGLAEFARELDHPNPKIRLDNGDIVWGGECWWGPEDVFRSNMEQYKTEGYEIREVRITDVRATAHNVETKEEP